MISFTQTKEEKDTKIDQLKTDLRAAEMSSDGYKLKLNTLTIHSEKQKEQIIALQQSYDDTVQKLHHMNKARHDLETKMTEEIERNRSLQDIIRIKEENLLKQQGEIEDLDRKCIDLERNIESIEIKKQGLERQFDLQKK